MGKFSDLVIRNLKPKPKPYVVREDAPRGEGGFAVRVMPSGAKSWQLIYSFEGERKWLSLGSYPAVSLADAREAFRQKRKLLASGIDPGAEQRQLQQQRREAMTVNELCDDFLEKYCQVKKRPRSAKEDEMNLQRDVRETIGKRKARDITRADIIDIIDIILARGAGTQANRTLATVRKMFAWALERSIVEFNPAAGISKPKTETPKERALSLEEIKIFWNNAGGEDLTSQDIAKALKLVLLTGCRPGEILGFRWEDITGNWLEISGSKTKNKQPHRVYLSSLTWELLGKKQKNGLIIQRWNGEPIPVYALSYWVRNNSFLGLSNWTPHDLRRTCATRLAEAGVYPHVVQKIMNHVARGITGQVYDRYSYSQEMANALEGWGQQIKTIVGSDSSRQKIVRLHRGK